MIWGSRIFTLMYHPSPKCLVIPGRSAFRSLSMNISMSCAVIDATGSINCNPPPSPYAVYTR
jgi:hypothetical protein